jgi:hypothetical protein
MRKRETINQPVGFTDVPEEVWTEIRPAEEERNEVLFSHPKGVVHALHSSISSGDCARGLQSHEPRNPGLQRWHRSV